MTSVCYPISSNALHGISSGVQNKMKLVYGFGTNDSPAPVRVNGKTIPSYKRWQNTLQRCYCPKFLALNPTYVGCSVHEDWLLFSNFQRFFDKNYIQGYQLDKDLLIHGNREYSEGVCVYSFLSGWTRLWTKRKVQEESTLLEPHCWSMENLSLNAEIQLLRSLKLWVDSLLNKKRTIPGRIEKRNMFEIWNLFLTQLILEYIQIYCWNINNIHARKILRALKFKNNF